VGARMLSLACGALKSKAWPNIAVEPTPYSLRFASASGRGSPLAFGSSIAALILLCKNPWSASV
jgi:hypothetical protein